MVPLPCSVKRKVIHSCVTVFFLHLILLQSKDERPQHEVHGAYVKINCVLGLLLPSSQSLWNSLPTDIQAVFILDDIIIMLWVWIMVQTKTSPPNPLSVLGCWTQCLVLWIRWRTGVVQPIGICMLKIPHQWKNVLKKFLKNSTSIDS